MSLENVDIPTLRNAIEQTHEMAGLVKSVVLDFDKYARGATNLKKKKALKEEISILTGARQDVFDNGRLCVAMDGALDISQQNLIALAESEKKWVLDKVVNLQLSLFEAMHIIVRAVPKRNKLHGRARKVLSQMSVQTLLGGVN